MTRVYRIPTSQVEGNSSDDNNTSEIRPYGDVGFYIGNNNKLELLMFDGVRTHVNSKVLNKGTFYGGDADSSDNLNRDTIKLVPDEALRQNGSDQYLVIDPTYGEPGHIHIRAGGTIDNSTADLFLGGELNNVRISDLGNYVQISADAGGEGATQDWRFDSVGGLTFPDGSVQTTAFTGATVITETLDSVTDRGAVTTNGITVGSLATTDINNTLSAQVGNRITNVPFPEGAGVPFQYTWISSGPEVQALIALGDLTGYSVTQTALPGTLTVLGMVNLGGTLGVEFSGGISGDPGNTLTFTSPDYAAPAAQPVDITVANNTWSFRDDGTLIAPSTIAFGDGNRTNINQINNNFVITTNTGPGNPYSWTFDEFGNLTLPGGAVIDTYAEGAENSTYFWSAPGEVIAVRSMIAENVFGGGININPSGSVDITAQDGNGGVSWSFNVDGSLTFSDNTVQTTAYPGITNTHSGSSVIVPGIQNATRNNLSVRVTNNNNTLDVEVNYQNPDTTVNVSAYRMYPAPVNVYAGPSSKTSGNTIWDNFGNLSAPGDSIGFTFTDQSFSKVYRVTVIAEVMPDGEAAGQAYCIIEQLR